MLKKPRVSIIIPCRNEEAFIGRCLSSILANDYPAELLEVLVVDGRSTDHTRAIVKAFEEEHRSIRLLENPALITPAAMNVGIRAALGNVVIIASAHSEYRPDFVSKSVEWLDRTGAEVVGGPLVTKPGAQTLVAILIALATSHPFGVGNSKFRTSTEDEFVDTVPFGAYRREVFNGAGLFDERLLRNQDIEFCSRILAQGGKIFMTAELQASYFSRATLAGLASQVFQTGMWNVLTVKLRPCAFRWRHFVPFLFVAALTVLAFGSVGFQECRILGAIIAGSYLAAALLASVDVGLKASLKYAPLLPPVFLVLHLAYGIGSWCGLVRVAATPWGSTPTSPVPNIPRPERGSR